MLCNFSLIFSAYKISLSSTEIIVSVNIIVVRVLIIKRTCIPHSVFWGTVVSV